MTLLADILGWVGYGLITYALPKLAHENPRIALRGWYAEVVGNVLAIFMGILTGLTSVILFNTLFAVMCGQTIARLRQRVRNEQ